MQPVVGNHEGPTLIFAEVFQADDGNLCHAEQLCCFISAVPGDQLPDLVDQHRHVEVELGDTPGKCLHMAGLVVARVAGVRPYLVDRHIFDDVTNEVIGSFHGIAPCVEGAAY